MTRQAWTREELDKAEELFLSGLRHDDIGKCLGRNRHQVRGALARIGRVHKQSWRKRDDWPEIERVMRDCLETKLMSMPQVCEHLNALGHRVSQSWLYKKLNTLDASIKRQAKLNGERRSNASRKRASMTRKMRAQECR